ncbi:hypothetical protein FNO43_24710 [Escherichia coli]|nr:hypothetical protein [Escherichia coli]EFB2820042.1 hypothetical protein [Escherichia coli]EFB5533432.1 hypothetical protein [Escherichia coli]
MHKNRSRKTFWAVFMHRMGEIRARSLENQSYRASGLTLLIRFGYAFTDNTIKNNRKINPRWLLSRLRQNQNVKVAMTSETIK